MDPNLVRDSDGDGVADTFDNCPCAFNPAQLDSDIDGWGDSCDADPYNQFVPGGTNDNPDGDLFTTDHDNCPCTPNNDQTDSDGDGWGDVCDSCDYRLVELPIYGLGRVGVARPNISIYDLPEDTIYTRNLDLKYYELTDHLGNVRGVIGDRKLAGDPGVGDYAANLLSYSHSYPYGMPQPGRVWDSAASYRYGFNGMETDPEVKGDTGLHFTSYFRQYDPRMGRWWSNDPVVHPSESPYTSMYDNPVYYSDPWGDCGSCSDASDHDPGTVKFERDSEGNLVFWKVVKNETSGENTWVKTTSLVDIARGTLSAGQLNESSGTSSTATRGVGDLRVADSKLVSSESEDSDDSNEFIDPTPTPKLADIGEFVMDSEVIQHLVWFGRGFAFRFIDNVFTGAPSTTIDEPVDAPVTYDSGKLLGDLLGAGWGLGAMLIGETESAVGVLAIPETFGGSTVIVVNGVAVTWYGALVTGTSAVNFYEDLSSFGEGSHSSGSSGGESPPRTIQTGGNKIYKSTERKLQKYYQEHIDARGVESGELGKALESLKRDQGLGPDAHNKILENGDYVDKDTGKLIGNIFDYLN